MTIAIAIFLVLGWMLMWCSKRKGVMSSDGDFTWVIPEIAGIVCIVIAICLIIAWAILDLLSSVG